LIDTVKKLLSFLDHRSRLQLYLLLIPALLTALLEMASFGMILPLIPALMGEKNSAKEFFERFSGIFFDVDPGQFLVLIIALFSGLFILKNICILGMIYIINRFVAYKLALFSQRMFRLYLYLPYTFHLQRNSSEILYNLSQGGPVAFDGLRLMLTIVMECTLVITTGILLLVIEPEIVLWVTGFLLVVGFLFYQVMAPIFRRWGEMSHSLESQVVKTISQTLGAIKDIKVLNCYSYLFRIYGKQTNGMANYHSRSMTAQHLPRLLMETVIIMGFGVIVLVLLEIRGSVFEVITVLGLFGMAALRLMPSINRILGSTTELKHRASRIDALFKDLNQGIELRELPSSSIVGPAQPFDHEIQLKNLSFRYEGTDQTALFNINISILKGESIGIVGVSGSGKSTMVDVIMGLFAPSAGQLLVDGKDVSGNLEPWQRHLGYVPQQIYLVDETLRRNIAFGLEDTEIDEEQVLNVIALANLNELVDDLAEGLDTVVGERGIRISGGQRQRIGIARALYRDPDIIVFDEATAALDNETEREITLALESLASEKTIIVIAHRLSTITNCDRLIFMDQGKIVDSGDFNTLMKANRDFQRMVKLGNLDPAGNRVD